MRITRLEAIPFRLPRRTDVRWAGLEMGIGNFVLVRLHTDGDVVGLGEVNPLPDWGSDHGRQGGETQASVCALLSEIVGPAIVGLDPCNRTMVRRAVDRYLRGHPYVKASVDMALHDIMGKVSAQSVTQLLGGPARDGVEVSHMLGLMPVEDAVAEAEAAWGEGVRAFQIKGGVSPDRDVGLICKLRERLPTSAVLRLDLNGTKRSAKQVRAELGEALELLNYLEQPVEGVVELARSTRDLPVPIIADESCWTVHDALDLAQLGAADAFSIYVAKAGGITGSMEIDVVASSTARLCDVNGGFESGVGNAANLHVATAGRSTDLPCVISATALDDSLTSEVAARYYTDDIVTESFTFTHGTLHAPTGPGLGVTIDEERLARYRVDD